MEKVKKIALVTGGSRGLGRDMAVSLAKKGHDVVITYAGNKNEADNTIKLVEEAGGKCAALQLNLKNLFEIDKFIIGKPIQIKNQPSEAVKKINPFIKKIKNKFPEKHIQLAEERFTSQMAFQTMIDGGVKKMDRLDKSMVDKISASIILRSFLDNRSNKKENNKLK